MSLEVGKQANDGADESIKKMMDVDKAGAPLDDVNLFAKLIKKAEEIAQQAV